MTSEQTRSKIQTVCLAVIATAVVTYLIFWLRPVLVPFVVALFVVSGITPVLNALEKRLGVSRLIASAITFLIGLGVLILLGFSLWLSVLQLAETGPAYRERVSEIITTVQGWLSPSPIPMEADNVSNLELVDAQATEATNENSPTVVDSKSIMPPFAPAGSISSSTDKLEEFRHTMDGYVRIGLGKISTELFNLVSTSIVVLIYVFFLLLGSVEVSERNKTIAEIDQQVRSYLFLKTIISILTGAAFGFALWLFGVPMSLTFGVLAFLLNYIQNIGPIVASVLPIPFILLHPEGSIIWMLTAIGVTSAIQTVSGNVIEPKLMGDSSDLHPVVILLGLMFWGMMWGITGMFLATPIMSGLKIVLDQLETTKPIAAVLAGRWSELKFPSETDDVES